MFEKLSILNNRFKGACHWTYPMINPQSKQQFSIKNKVGIEQIKRWLYLWKEEPTKLYYNFTRCHLKSLEKNIVELRLDCSDGQKFSVWRLVRFVEVGTRVEEVLSAGFAPNKHVLKLNWLQLLSLSLSLYLNRTNKANGCCQTTINRKNVWLQQDSNSDRPT